MIRIHWWLCNGVCVWWSIRRRANVLESVFACDCVHICVCVRVARVSQCYRRKQLLIITLAQLESQPWTQNRSKSVYYVKDIFEMQLFECCLHIHTAPAWQPNLTVQTFSSSSDQTCLMESSPLKRPSITTTVINFTQT